MGEERTLKSEEESVLKWVSVFTKEIQRARPGIPLMEAEALALRTLENGTDRMVNTLVALDEELDHQYGSFTVSGITFSASKVLKTMGNKEYNKLLLARCKAWVPNK